MNWTRKANGKPLDPHITPRELCQLLITLDSARALHHSRLAKWSVGEFGFNTKPEYETMAFKLKHAARLYTIIKVGEYDIKISQLVEGDGDAFDFLKACYEFHPNNLKSSSQIEIIQFKICHPISSNTVELSFWTKTGTFLSSRLGLKYATCNSYHQYYQTLNSESNIKLALRGIVRRQINEKMRSVRHCENVFEMSDEYHDCYEIDNLEVHHDPTFETLVDGWCEESGIELMGDVMLAKPPTGFGGQLMDGDMQDSWWFYHLNHANLYVLCRECHKAEGKYMREDPNYSERLV